MGWEHYFLIVLGLPGCAHLNLDLRVGSYPLTHVNDSQDIKYERM